MAPPFESEPDSAGEAVAAADPAELRRRLLAFFDAHRRDLPWRRTGDPYRIWVSEVMLQQTRVETVVPYYERWMERFPDVEALARAERDDVLGAWKGLGYYSRARNLHDAAGVVRERFGGRLPRDPVGLRELPGVGEYTAGAVASIAFGVPVPAVDGNVRRVLSRLHDLSDPTPAGLRGLAARLVDPDRPGDWNEALMELGATVCTPTAPGCGRCPLAGACAARAAGTQEERPRPRKRTRVRSAEVGVAVPVAPDGRVLLVRRPEDGLLGGMEEFPGGELEEGGGDGRAEDAGAAGSGRDPALRAALARLDSLGLEADGPPVPLPEVEHAFTHLKVTYRPWWIPVAGEGAAEGPARGNGERRAARWIDPAELGSANLPVAQQRIAESLPAPAG